TALRIDRLRGRTDDMVIYKGVNFYPRQVETVLLAHAGVSHEYQIVLDAEGGGERMTVMVETDPGCDPGVAARIKRDLHDALALGPDIRLRAAGRRRGGDQPAAALLRRPGHRRAHAARRASRPDLARHQRLRPRPRRARVRPRAPGARGVHGTDRRVGRRPDTVRRPDGGPRRRRARLRRGDE